MVDKADLRACHWKFGDSTVTYESETNASFMSDARDKVVRDSMRGRQEPESLKLGKLLRQSHITLSMRPDREVAKSEARMRFVTPKMEVAQSFADTNGAELRLSNVDLAVNKNESKVRDWTSVNRATMSANQDEKFACKRPQGFDTLGEELRKSNVLLHAGRHDFRQSSVPIPRSESACQFVTKPISPMVGFGATLGKELRTSSIDVAYGVPKTTKSWQSQQHAIMANETGAKWACEQPKGFQHLIAELRKTNISLGTDRIVYGTEGNKRPVQSIRQDPAGHVVGC